MTETFRTPAIYERNKKGKRRLLIQSCLIDKATGEIIKEII